MASLSACHHPVETRHAMSLPAELVAIDSLMQIRPDSALTMLLDSPMDDHYYQLLLSEALYKNDSAQLNRSELLQAMVYFDSVDNAFLSARCHYMNGVGYYEMDSVVPACAAYLKALEIMENHFKEEDLVGYKAKLVALAYSHLCLLFTDQYLHVQAVGFAKKTYEYYHKLGYSSWQSAWALNKIGLNYHMMEQLDSAAYYYQRAANALDDTTNLMYRDICSHQVSIEYELTGESERALLQLKRLLFQAESEKEYFARCLPLGEVFYHEQKLDSAVVYLEKVFFGNASVPSKKQAAEWLVEIHNEKGESIKAQPYADYLVPFANLNENQGFIKSQLADIYQDYERRRKENLHQLQVEENHRRVAHVMEVFMTCIALVALLYFIKTKQLKSERHEHKIKYAALLGKLKRSNETLKKERENKIKASIDLKKHHDTTLKYEDEPVCRYILSVCNDKKNPIKSTISISAYSNIALNHEQEAQLKDAATRHFGQLFEYLKANYPKLSRKDFFYCYLCLLGLDNSQIAVMTQHSYRTIWEREKRLQRLFNTDDKISVVLHGFLIG